MSLNGVRELAKTKNIVTELNVFLRSQNRSIIINESLEVVTILAIFTVQIVGILFSCLVINTLYTEIRIVSLNINKNLSKVTSSSLSIFGFWKYLFDIKEIQKIVIKKIESDDGSSLYFTSMILMRSGKKIELGSNEDRAVAIAKVNKVQRFINISVEEIS
jgi:hypothetical protein